MKTIVAGSRSIQDYEVVKKAILLSGFVVSASVDEIVSGGAAGVDRLGEKFAREYKIGIRRFLPDWSLGRQAGHIRNRQMGDYADALIAVWDGRSHGTKGMIDYARKKGLRVYIHTI